MQDSIYNVPRETANEINQRTGKDESDLPWGMRGPSEVFKHFLRPWEQSGAERARNEFVEESKGLSCKIHVCGHKIFSIGKR